MKQKITIVFLFLTIIVLTGCTKKIIDTANKTTQDLQKIEIERTKNRDTKRVANIKQLSTLIQFYVADNNKFPSFTDNKGNYITLKLINNSSDFIKLETIIKGIDKTLIIPVDPSDPERYYEYYSDGKTYSVKTYLEENNIENCKEIKSNYCELEIKEDIKSALINYQKFLDSLDSK